MNDHLADILHDVHIYLLKEWFSQQSLNDYADLVSSAGRSITSLNEYYVNKRFDGYTDDRQELICRL